MNKCFFGIHNWDKWSYPIDAQNNDFTKVQVRCCKDCGRIQAKKMKQPWNVWVLLSDITNRLGELK